VNVSPQVPIEDACAVRELMTQGKDPVTLLVADTMRSVFRNPPMAEPAVSTLQSRGESTHER
jgi:hypothetical protein